MEELQKNNYGFSLPDDYDFNTSEILNRIEIEKEVSAFPLLNQIRKESKKAFLIPDTFFPEIMELSFLEKITNGKEVRKNAKIFSVSGFFRKAAVIFFAVIFSMLIYYILKDHTKKNINSVYMNGGKDTCLTLACIEKEELVKELFYEISDEEIDNYH